MATFFTIHHRRFSQLRFFQRHVSGRMTSLVSVVNNSTFYNFCQQTVSAVVVAVVYLTKSRKVNCRQKQATVNEHPVKKHVNCRQVVADEF